MKVQIAKRSEITDGKSKMVQVGEKMVALFLWKGNFFAVDELCPHRAGPLSEGLFDGETVTCPWHGAKFDLSTGKCLQGPSQRSISSYPVFLEGDSVWIEIRNEQEAVGES
jgi:3-phenylpropionate/trans-cinnamate dioxygenase ferredoxin component